MIKHTFLYALGFVFVVLTVLIIFRMAFPLDHSLGSVAIMVTAFLYAIIFKTKTKEIIFSCLLYTLMLLLDSQNEIWIVTNVKASESIVFPIIAGFVISIPLLFGACIKHYVAKLRERLTTNK